MNRWCECYQQIDELVFRLETLIPPSQSCFRDLTKLAWSFLAYYPDKGESLIQQFFLEYYLKTSGAGRQEQKTKTKGAESHIRSAMSFLYILPILINKFTWVEWSFLRGFQSVYFYSELSIYRVIYIYHSSRKRTTSFTQIWAALPLDLRVWETRQRLTGLLFYNLWLIKYTSTRA